ncbi:carboxypeptidase-like regulatory domain-containing protein [Flavobacterium sp. ZT3R18]|uniref:carboxypeptidase-like regulatory domain-containing protein n=1 Tax=Flavobacterium sp. ZT3R18 TaxID=2594429 RepID=UPI00117AF613|nr:carboxypeptidase-like regulatory domain-containing protein [Flavobacterium sp. ZT3R18]TRX38749.1 carboxypeptidase-like regulatory domain-containing protein [Flavobacterium sp. ZT3R18]
MKNNTTLLIIVLFITQFLTAQEKTEKWIKGQITSETIALQGINVTNTASKIKSVSDQYGNFSILAKQGEVLSFSAVDYEPLRKIINKQEFKLGSIVVNMTATSIELKEVVVNGHPEISAENLGIIPRDQVKLTAAERKVYTATQGTDAVLNYFSGRTKMLKKEVALEKKEILMSKLEYLFDDKYYIETLKIPEELIKGFQYYCVEDADFANSIQSKNKTMSMFLIVGLASNYNKNRVDGVEIH